MFNKFLLLLLLLILPTNMVWGRIYAHSNFQNQTDQGSETPFSLGDPTYYGSGCPDGTVEVTSPDSSVVSVLFSAYQAKTTSSILRDRKSCNMALPVYVEPGYSVGIFKVDYRGYAFAPPGFGRSRPTARFDAEYFFAGYRGPSKSRSYSDYDDIFTETDSVGVYAWSPCGGSTNFRINTSLIASKPSSRDEDVLIQIDTEDITSAGFHYYFSSRNC
jgi:hypothetical protein